MRVMGLWYPSQKNPPPTEKQFADMGKLIMEMVEKGVMLDTGGWDVSTPSKILERTGDKVTVKDGPYAESKEMVGGFVIMEVKDMKEAVEWGERFIQIAGQGHSEMRPLPAAPPKK